MKRLLNDSEMSALRRIDRLACSTARIAHPICHRLLKNPLLTASLALTLIGATSCQRPSDKSNYSPTSSNNLSDESDGADWPGYGRSYGEQHYSPLKLIDDKNISRLGLAWSVDLDVGNPISAPIEVGGTLYAATGYSVITAVDVLSGKVLWRFDPEAPAQAGEKLRLTWGIRGLTWWNGKLFVGTADGRLIAVNAQTGKQVWSVLTVGKDDRRFISGAPRVFAGKVIIGHGGADSAPTRGYVTAYDAETGRQAWRFFTVPGDPSKGFEDQAQEIAAKTWHGEWWKFGGGGTVWNAITYDPESDTIFIGTGNGAPWNHRIRSEGKGDNLFLSSIVALEGKTGKYRWHYQTNPGESWDYNAAMDMQLAELTIDGKRRKVLMQAPKNGFFYVIDRTTGKLISADPVVKVTWAKGIDPKTGRPMEVEGARYPDGKSFDMWPSGAYGAHTWLPSAFSPSTGLVYIPLGEIGYRYSDSGIDLKSWKFPDHNHVATGVNWQFIGHKGSTLLAWDPVARKARWRIKTEGEQNGGVLATAGNLVFQGQSTGILTAYDANSGSALWTFDAGAPVLAPPISYRVKGKQYITVLSGVGSGTGVSADLLAKPNNYWTQARRILTFALDGKQVLPSAPVEQLVYATDPSFKPNPQEEARGAVVYGYHCALCHGPVGRSGGTAPELAASGVPAAEEAFKAIVRGGDRVARGMPQFQEFTDWQIADLRQYIRSETRSVKQQSKRSGK